MFISIKIKQMAIKKSRRVAMKKLLLGLTTFLLSFTLVFSGYACSCNKQKVEPYTYITLDINPSFEIVACGETIVEIKACNQDASILLHGEHLVGLSVESASKKIAQLSQQLGFISEFSSNNVRISVASDNDHYGDALINKVEKGIKQGCSLNISIVNGSKASNVKKVDELKQKDYDTFKNLTPAKLNLIESIMAYDSSFTYEQGAKLNIKQLYGLLAKHKTYYAYYLGKDLQTEIASQIQEKELEFKEQLIELLCLAYGTEKPAEALAISMLWEQVCLLNNFIDGAKITESMLVLDIGDVERIVYELGLPNQKVLENQDGKVTVKSVYDYLDSKITYQTNSIIEDDILDSYLIPQTLIPEQFEQLSGIFTDITSTLTIEQVEQKIVQLEEELQTKIQNTYKQVVSKNSTLKANYEQILKDLSYVEGDVLLSFKEQLTALDNYYSTKKAELIINNGENV